MSAVAFLAETLELHPEDVRDCFIEKLEGCDVLWDHVSDRLSALPMELREQIALHLDAASLYRLCQTSREMNLLCEDDQLWRQKYILDFEQREKFFPEHTWKKNYELRMNPYVPFANYLIENYSLVLPEIQKKDTYALLVAETLETLMDPQFKIGYLDVPLIDPDLSIRENVEQIAWGSFLPFEAELIEEEMYNVLLAQLVGVTLPTFTNLVEMSGYDLSEWLEEFGMEELSGELVVWIAKHYPLLGVFESM
uniref:F-box-like protein n=1 Tax=Pithovirus LCPAC304 TaxID=2506594 RepID=A0A481Z877_9VIRU|nr:MAG: F-box-like protein [Pithovirus LCPAC304]